MEFAREDVYSLTSDVEGATVPLDEVRFPYMEPSMIISGYAHWRYIASHAPLFFFADTYEVSKLLASTNCVKTLNNLISSIKC